MTLPGPTPDFPPTGARGRLAAAVAEAVDAVGGARRSGGPGVEVATQHRNGKVVGVQLAEKQVLVQVTAERLPLPLLVEQVRAAAARVLSDQGDSRPVVVTVDDLNVDRLPSGRIQ